MICCLIIFSCGSKTNIRKITIAQAGDFFLYAPLYIAVDAKIFEENEIEVSIVSTGGDEKTWAAVLSKNASFGIADPTFIAISDEKGVPGKVVASIVNGVPFWGITYNENIVKFTNNSELKSYKIGTFPSPSTAYTLQRKMFLDAELEPNIREGAFGTMLAMLKSNQADIVLELEPNVSQAIHDGAHIIYSLSEIYGDFAITGLTTIPELIENDPKLVQDVVNSIQAALHFIRSNPDSSLSLLSKRFPEIDKDVAYDAFNRVVNEGIIPITTATNRNAWEKAINLRKETGDIKNPKIFEYYINNKFAKSAEEAYLRINK